MQKQKISIIAIIFGLSIWMVLFAWEGSFSMQCVLPFLLLLIGYNILAKKTKIKIEKEAKTLLYLVLLIIFSTVINSIIHADVISFENIFGIMYFVVIFLWFTLVTSETYNEREINFMILNYLIVATICSIETIKLSFSGATGKIAITNWVGTLTDENLTSAIISIAPIYCLIILLKSRKKLTMLNLLYVIMFVINVLAVCLTGSRAAMIGDILAVVLIVCTYLFQNFNLKKLIITIIIILLGIILSFYLISAMPEWIYNRYFGKSYSDNSNKTRITVWKNAIDGISDQPLIGFGMGTFPNLDKYPYTAVKSVPAHETYLDIAIYSGIIGLLIFLRFLYEIFGKFIKNKKLRSFLPVIADMLFISIIIGADKTIFLWNNIMLLKIISKSVEEGENYQNDKIINGGKA